MSDSSRERCKIGEVRVNMNRVEISRDFQVRFVGQRSIKCSGNVGGIQRVAVGKRGSQTLRRSMMLQISQDGVALRIILLEVHRADLDEDL